MILESSGGWTESVCYTYLIRGTYQMQLLRGLLANAHNDAESYIYARMIQDHARHLTYGYDHLKYAANHHEGETAILRTLLAIGEAHFAAEVEQSATKPAMAIILGGGIEAAKTVGMETYLHLVGDFVRDYVKVCEWLGVDRTEVLNPRMARYLEY